MRAAWLLVVVAACARESAPIPPDPAPEVAPPLVPLAIADYPEPPQQHAAWTDPRTSLDPALVAAADKLFAAGFPDPRGCEYRAIGVDVGDLWSGGTRPTSTTGWVLPGTTFAIAWDGLVYRTRSIGPLGNLTADVKALASRKPTDAFHELDQGAVALQAGAMAAILALRAGNTAAAEALMKRPVAHAYEELSTAWVTAMFERGITAHMHGDVALAIESWRRIPALRQTLALTDVQFLDEVPALLADERRRAAHPMPPLDTDALTALASRPKPERIARLVAGLDQVAARQMGQPGGVSLGDDPIVQALIAEGEPAVEPLIEAYETDERRTRSVQFWRDFTPDREVLATYEAEYVALSGILDFSFFEPGSTGDNLTGRGAAGRKALGEQVRAYWQAWRGVPMEERWYRMLADDKRDPKTWLVAADKLVQPTNETTVPSSSIEQFVVTTKLPPGQKPALRGESMRGKTSPSVTALFERRLAAMTEPGQHASMLFAFARWDLAAARPELTRFLRSQPQISPRAMAMLADVRIASGDPDAIGDYAAWISSTSPGDLFWSSIVLVFEPMIQHRHDPAIARAAAAMFATKGSPWLPLPSDVADELVGTDLVLEPSFRRLVLAQLADRTKVGTVTVHGSQWHFQSADGGSTSSIEPHAVNVPREGVVLPVRVADQYASYATRRTHVAFELYWPIAERDRAIAEIIAKL